MKYLALRAIRLYQKVYGFIVAAGIGRPSPCTFFPSCSEYSRQAFETYPPLKAFFLSIRRISRCHPWQKNHIDPLL